MRDASSTPMPATHECQNSSGQVAAAGQPLALQGKQTGDGYRRPVAWASSFWRQRCLCGLGAIGLLVVWASTGAGKLAAEEPEITQNLLQLPSSQRAAAVLSRPAGFTMSSLPLRKGLMSIAAGYRISIWIDRRIDPNRQITLRTTAQESLQESLSRVAALAEAEVGLIENVVYFGPKGEVAKLERAAVELHDALQQFGNQSAASSTPNSQAGRSQFAQSPLMQRLELRWDELETPQQVLESVVESCGLQLDARLPHDLMHAGNLEAACAPATQLVLICGGFGLEPDPSALPMLGLSPVRDQTVWRSSYPSGSISALRVKQLQVDYPQGQAVRRGVTWLVRGPTQYHFQLQVQPNVRRAPPASGRVSGEIAGTVENILTQLATMHQCDVNWHASISANERAKYVRFKVENVDIEGILDELSKAASLEVRRHESTIDVTK